jgi:hypothetical protein
MGDTISCLQAGDGRTRAQAHVIAQTTYLTMARHSILQGHDNSITSAGNKNNENLLAVAEQPLRSTYQKRARKLTVR